FDSITVSSACNYDGILFSVSDMDISAEKISEYIKYFPEIIASNLYIKSNMKALKKYILKNINSKRIAIYSVISDPTSPTKSFYYTNLRIENPVFEINRLNYQLKPDKYILIHQALKPVNSLDYFEKLIQPLTHKPFFIFSNTDKVLSVHGIKVFPIPPYPKKITMEKKFGILKIKQTHLRQYLNASEISEVAKLMKKTNDEFSKKLRVLSHPLSDEQINGIVAKSLVNFIPSDIAMISKKTVIKGIREGDVTMEEIYNILKNPWDKIVYIKLKGSTLTDMINNFSDISTIYINSKLGKKPVFEKNKIYRMFTTLDFIKDNDSILNYITEFSILNIQIRHPLSWYLKNTREL
ncbi:MAG: 5'-nucleotidase C-terminal domain-containing protein, partial [Elusimicrobiales bacterium]